MPARHAVAVVSAAALLATGCGEKCKTETPQQVEALPSNCTAIEPGATVTVGIRLCPTCNQTGAVCDVDTSQADAFRRIQLDPQVEACEDVTSCGSAAPACLTNAIPCTFRAPTAPATYTIFAYDPASDQTVEESFVVAPGGTQTSCSI
jgi:hypothetical protein